MASIPAMEHATMKKRDVDWVIEYVEASDRIHPVVKQALINRLNPRLTRDEIDAARYQVMKSDPLWTGKMS